MRKESKEDKNEIEQLESDISSLAETLCSSKEENMYCFFLFFSFRLTIISRVFQPGITLHVETVDLILVIS